MASDPIPEPLRNQEVEAHQEPRFAESSDKRPINAVPANSPPPERSETEKPLIVVDNTLQGTARNLGSALRRVSNATREGTESAAQTRAELSQLARKSAESVKTRGTEKVLDARREAVWTLRQARAEAQVVVDELRNRMHEASRRSYEQVQRFSRRQPLRTVVIAAGIGLIVGIVLRIGRATRRYE